MKTKLYEAIMNEALAMIDEEEEVRQRIMGLDPIENLKERAWSVACALEEGQEDLAFLLASGNSDICALLGHNTIPIPSHFYGEDEVDDEAVESEQKPKSPRLGG